MNLKHSKKFLSIFVCLFLIFPISLEAADIPFYTANYKVKLGKKIKIPAGKSKRTVISESEGQVTAIHNVDTNVVSVFFKGSAYAQKSEMTINDDLVLLSKSEAFDDGESESVKFDLKKRIATWIDGSTQEIPPGNVYDTESWLIALMIDPEIDRTGEEIILFENNRFRKYAYETPRKQTIVENGRIYELLSVKLQNLEDETRSLTVDVNLQIGNVPWRITAKKKKIVITFELNSIQWHKSPS